MLNTTNSTVADVQSTAGGGKVQREATTAAATAAATAPAATASATTSDEQGYNAGVQSSNAPTEPTAGSAAATVQSIHAGVGSSSGGVWQQAKRQTVEAQTQTVGAQPVSLTHMMCECGFHSVRSRHWFNLNFMRHEACCGMCWKGC